MTVSTSGSFGLLDSRDMASSGSGFGLLVCYACCWWSLFHTSTACIDTATSFASVATAASMCSASTKDAALNVQVENWSVQVVTYEAYTPDDAYTYSAYSLTPYDTSSGSQHEPTLHYSFANTNTTDQQCSISGQDLLPCPGSNQSGVCIFDDWQPQHEYVLAVIVNEVMLLNEVFNTNYCVKPSAQWNGYIRTTSSKTANYVLSNAQDSPVLLMHEVNVSSYEFGYFQNLYFTMAPKQEEYELTNLYPNTLYNWTSRVKPDAGGFWSSERRGSMTTECDKPSKPPVIRRGAYFVEAIGKELWATVYWWPVSKRFQNCRIIKYRVYRIRRTDLRKAGKDLLGELILEENPSRFFRIKIAPYRNVYVYVDAVNIKGSNEYTAKSIIPIIPHGKDGRVMQCHIGIYASEPHTLDVYYFLDQLPLNFAPHSFTFYWCRNSTKCLTSINYLSSVKVREMHDWSQMQPLHEKLTVHHGYDLSVGLATKVQFSKSNTTENLGIVWHDCIQDTNKPPVAPIHMNISQNHDNQTAKLEWTPADCAKLGSTHYYEITVCQTCDPLCDIKNTSTVFFYERELSFSLAEFKQEACFQVLIAGMSLDDRRSDYISGEYYVAVSHTGKSSINQYEAFDVPSVVAITIIVLVFIVYVICYLRGIAILE